MPSPKEIFMKAVELLPGKSLIISNLPKDKLNKLRMALYRAKDSLSNTTVVISSARGELTLSKLTPEELIEKEYDGIVINEIDDNEFSFCIEESTTTKRKETLPKLKPGELELTAAQAVKIHHQEQMATFAREVDLKSQPFDSPDRQKYAEMQQEFSCLQKKVRDIRTLYNIEYIPIPATLEELNIQEKAFNEKMSFEEELELKRIEEKTIRDKAEKKKLTEY